MGDDTPNLEIIVAVDMEFGKALVGGHKIDAVGAD